MSPSHKGFIILLSIFVIGLGGCKQDGPAEKAGQEVDQAVEKAGKTIEETGQAIGDKAETIGEYMDDSAITAKIKAEILADPLLKSADQPFEGSTFISFYPQVFLRLKHVVCFSSKPSLVEAF